MIAVVEVADSRCRSSFAGGVVLVCCVRDSELHSTLKIGKDGSEWQFRELETFSTLCGMEYIFNEGN